MEQNEKKSIPFEALNDEQKQIMSSALESLKDLKVEMTSKEELITEKSRELKNLIKTLEESKAIKMNAGLDEHFTKSEENYSKITAVLMQELNAHIEFYSKYLGDEHPKKINPSIPGVKTLDEYINKTAKLIRNFGKKRKKEIDVLFSRYENGLTTQIRRLSTVQHYVQARTGAKK